MSMKLLAVICLASAGLLVSRADIYVDAAADPSSADGTQEHPYATIQAAVDAAQVGTTIRIAEGVYDKGGENTADSTSSRVKIDGKALHQNSHRRSTWRPSRWSRCRRMAMRVCKLGSWNDNRKCNV